MASTNIKLFDENKSNMMTDAEYGTNTQRANGVQTGVASSELQNKFQYQMSLVAYAVAQLMMANGLNAVDTDAVSTFVGNLSNSIVQKVLDKASSADMIAGTNNAKWVTPALVSNAPKGIDANVTLSSTGWVQTTDASGQTLYTQTFTVAGSTANSALVLKMDTNNYKKLADAGVSFFQLENDNGTLSAICVDAKPGSNLVIQVTLVEVKQNA